MGIALVNITMHVTLLLWPYCNNGTKYLTIRQASHCAPSNVSHVRFLSPCRSVCTYGSATLRCLIISVLVARQTRCVGAARGAAEINMAQLSKQRLYICCYNTVHGGRKKTRRHSHWTRDGGGGGTDCAAGAPLTARPPPDAHTAGSDYCC